MNDRKKSNIGTASGRNPVIVHGIFNNNQFNKERKIKAYLKKLKALGWEVPVATA